MSYGYEVFSLFFFSGDDPQVQLKLKLLSVVILEKVWSVLGPFNGRNSWQGVRQQRKSACPDL